MLKEFIGRRLSAFCCDYPDFFSLLKGVPIPAMCIVYNWYDVTVRAVHSLNPSDHVSVLANYGNVD